MGDKSEDLTLFWYSCAVAQLIAQLITYKNSPPNALSKYLSVLHSQISQASLSPTPSSAFGLLRVRAVYPVLQAMKKLRKGVQEQQGSVYVRAHTTH